MSEANLTLLILVSYHVVTALIGLVFTILGYRLFCRGVFETAANEIKASWGDRHLILKQAAPGTVLAVLGMVIVGFSVIRQVKIESGQLSRADGQSAFVFGQGAPPPIPVGPQPIAPNAPVPPPPSGSWSGGVAPPGQLPPAPPLGPAQAPIGAAGQPVPIPPPPGP